ncbi:MAG: zinc ribbon domain-containing protein [Thermoproteota archaeon]
MSGQEAFRCPYCGEAVGSGDAFCGYCGKQLPQSVYSKPVQRVVSAPPVERKTRLYRVPRDRMGGEKGEWLERYVQKIFDAAGFETERDKIVPASVGSAKHEIDVLAKSPEGNIVVECKDMNHVPKIMVDQFIQKFRDLQELGVAHAGAFVISKYESESEVSRYSEYLQKYGIVFLDANDLDQLWDNFKTHLDPLRFKEELKQLFGLAAMTPEFGDWSKQNLAMGEAISKRERAIQIGKAVLKTMGKIMWEMGRISAEGLGLVESEPKRRKKRTRRKKKSRR